MISRAKGLTYTDAVKYSPVGNLMSSYKSALSTNEVSQWTKVSSKSNTIVFLSNIK